MERGLMVSLKVTPLSRNPNGPVERNVIPLCILPCPVAEVCLMCWSGSARDHILEGGTIYYPKSCSTSQCTTGIAATGRGEILFVPTKLCPVRNNPLSRHELKQGEFQSPSAAGICDELVKLNSKKSWAGTGNWLRASVISGHLH